MTHNRVDGSMAEKFESSSPHHSDSLGSQSRASRRQKRTEIGGSGPGDSGVTREPAERWAPCRDHPGFEVSDLGRVKLVSTGCEVLSACAAEIRELREFKRRWSEYEAERWRSARKAFGIHAAMESEAK